MYISMSDTFERGYDVSVLTSLQWAVTWNSELKQILYLLSLFLPERFITATEMKLGHYP